MPVSDPKKVRIVKAGEVKLRSGVIKVEEGDGKVSYKCACDACKCMVSRPFPPKEGKPVLCGDCHRVAVKGKPSTRILRREGKLSYLTLCDRCGANQRTPFLPKKDQQFLCDACHRAQPQRSRIPIKKDVVVLGTKDEPLFWVPCDRCRTKVQLKFNPVPGEPFICPKCYDEERSREEKKRRAKEGKPETRMFFNIECVRCGRKETVDFVPRSLSEAICSRCYDEKKRRK